MDIQRAPVRKRKPFIFAALAVVAVVVVTVALSRLEPAAPTVERGTLWIDTVRRGTMVRQVRAPGTLVPEHIRLVSAVTAGRVEALPYRAGVTVNEATVLLELSNPDVQLQSLEAQRALTQSQAELVNLQTALETQRLTQQGVVATVKTDYLEAKRTATVTAALDERGLTTSMERDRAREKAEELASRLDIEQQRLKIISQAIDGQLSLQRAQVGRLRAIAEFQNDRVASMKVRAHDHGVLQDIALELGQWVVPGQLLAKVAQPGRLKAVLRAPETQAKDIVVGQKVAIDTRNGIVAGHVIRLDPFAANSTVGFEVALDGPLPNGARADLSVDGTVEIDRLEKTLYMVRPAYGQPESVVGIFRLDPDGRTASRVNVKLGRGSVNAVEILQGLSENDHVIVSDMSQWDNVDKVRIR